MCTGKIVTVQHNEMEDTRTEYDGDGVCTGICETTYDEFTRIRHIDYYDGDHVFRYGYLHELDQWGGIVKSATVLKDGTISNVTYH